MTKEQIEAWRTWYRRGIHTERWAGSFDELCDFALKALRPEGRGVIITAEWDKEFGQREPGTNAIFLMAGDACLGYIDRDGDSYMACVGVGLGAPVVAIGVIPLEDCKRAVEQHYSSSPQPQEGK